MKKNDDVNIFGPADYFGMTALFAFVSVKWSRAILPVFFLKHYFGMTVPVHSIIIGSYKRVLPWGRVYLKSTTSGASNRGYHTHKQQSEPLMVIIFRSYSLRSEM